MNRFKLVLSLLALALCVLAVGVGIQARGYSSPGRKGGVLTDAEKSSVAEAISLLKCVGEAEMAENLEIMLEEGKINREENPIANRGTGNSADATRVREDGHDLGAVVNSWAINLGKKGLANDVVDKPGGIGRIAGVLMHECGHLANLAPDNCEAIARAWQAKVLCKLACSDSCPPENGPSAKEKAALCKLYKRSKFFALNQSSRPRDWPKQRILNEIGECACCEEPEEIYPPMDGDVSVAATFVSPEWNPGCGTYSPSQADAALMLVDIFCDPAPRYYAMYWSPNNELEYSFF